MIHASTWSQSNFFCPTNENICWVPSNHILCSIDPPSTKNGCRFKISEIDLTKMIEQNSQDL